MGWTIELKNVWFSYVGGDYVVKNVSLKVNPGEVTAIIGPTGCGKSTILMIMAGLLTPIRGKVYYNGEPLEDILSKVKKHIGILFQDPNDQLFNSTVYDEIAYALRSLGLNEEVTKERVLNIAKQLKVNHLLDRPPFRLSVGEMKKVALASVLVYNPNVILLDEPTANLDFEGVEVVKNIVLKAKNEGKTVVLASHDLDFILQVSDKIYIVNDGQVKVKCKPTDLLRDEVLSKVNLYPPLIYSLIRRLNLDHNELLKLIRG